MMKSSYIQFSRKKWASFRDSIKFLRKDIQLLKNINKEISIKEVKEIYLPLSKLLNIYINSDFKNQFSKHFLKKIPYIISIAGSVSVGKSTTAHILKALLSKFSKFREIEVITTDGFLYPNKILKKKGLMEKKGFPQSYDTHRLINFISDLKSGISEIIVPIYSHINYDILESNTKIIKKPDILILEGLNVLQRTGIKKPNHFKKEFISDFVDFSIYVHASEKLLKNWFINRFLKLRKHAFKNPKSYFYNYSQISKEKATKIAITLWKKINSLNLKNNILPTRKRANLIIIKSNDHIIKYIKIKKTFMKNYTSMFNAFKAFS